MWEVVFSTWSMPRCYKHGQSAAELLRTVQKRRGKGMSVVESHYLATAMKSVTVDTSVYATVKCNVSHALLKSPKNLAMNPKPICSHSIKQNNELHGLSPRANYTDRATAACRRSDCQLLRIKGATLSRDGSLQPYSRFSRQEPRLFYQVAPQLYSRG
jgi:hypothetical protein